MTNTMTKQTSATKTEITGRTAARASGHDLTGKARTWNVGDRTTITTTVAAGDGGELQGSYTVEIVSLGIGTEYGMLGTTGIALLRYVDEVPVDDFGTERRPRDREFPLAIRHLVNAAR
jgi:hypothetical protein